MTTWIITAVLAGIIVLIIRAELRCGRRTKTFFATVVPEIDELNKHAMAKYREVYGRDPTGAYPIIEVPAPDTRGLFGKK